MVRTRSPDATYQCSASSAGPDFDGVVVGGVSASLHEPVDGAERELQIDLGRRRLHVNSLAVAGSYRRHRVGSALIRAVEEWGREKGAEVIGDYHRP